MPGGLKGKDLKVAEELRFFLRIALYTVPVAVVYWFLSYEVAGSVLLLLVGLAAIFFSAAMAWVVRHSSSDIPSVRKGRVGAAVDRAIGFAETQDERGVGPLEVEEAPLPTSSIWPLVIALALLGTSLGLLYGGWLWIPSAVMGVIGAWGWLTQLDA